MTVKLWNTEIKSTEKSLICPKCNSDYFDGEFCGNCYEITAINRSNFGGCNSEESFKLITEKSK